MVFEERFALLIRNAQEDYRQILLSSNFDEDDENRTANAAERITIARTMLSYMETSLEESPADVETLLFHDRPLSAFYEDFRKHGTPLWGGLLEPLNRFIISSKHQMNDVIEQWDTVPMDILQKAENYFRMERLIIKHDATQEQTDDMER